MEKYTKDLILCIAALGTFFVALWQLPTIKQNTENSFLLRISERYGSKELLRAKAVLKRFSMEAEHSKKSTDTLEKNSDVKTEFKNSDMQESFFAGQRLGESTMLRINQFYSDDLSHTKGLKQKQLQLESIESQIKKTQSKKIQNCQNDNKFEDLVYVESLYEFLVTVNHFFEKKYITDGEITKMLGKSFAFYSGLYLQYKNSR